jgi:hypothetical protein
MTASSSMVRERSKTMAIAVLIEVPNVSAEQGAAILRELGLSTTPPEGQILHIEGPMEGGLRVVDVWESEDALNAFVGGKLMPACQRAGVALPADLAPKAVWPVSAILK